MRLLFQGFSFTRIPLIACEENLHASVTSSTGSGHVVKLVYEPSFGWLILVPASSSACDAGRLLSFVDGHRAAHDGPIVVHFSEHRADEHHLDLLAQLDRNDAGVYLPDCTNLSELSSSLFSQVVSTGKLMNGPAAVQDAAGTTILLQTAFGSMTGRAAGSGSVGALRIYPGSPPTFSVAWCGPASGRGSPMVTSTDGSSNAIAWLIGAEGDERLHAFDADTGAVVFAGGGAGDAMSTVQHFNTPIVAHGWIYVGGNGRIYGFHP